MTDALKHWGVLGMHWGQRKSNQNGRRELAQKAASNIRKSGIMKRKLSATDVKKIKHGSEVAGRVLLGGLAAAVFVGSMMYKPTITLRPNYLALPSKTIEYLDLKFM